MNEKMNGRCSQNVCARTLHGALRQHSSQQGYSRNHTPPLAPQAADGVNLICVRPAQAFPDRLEPRSKPACSCRDSLHKCLSYLRETRRPQPHAANRRLPPTRLEVSMFMLALSSTLPESALCSKAHCSNLRFEKIQARRCFVTFDLESSEAALALHYTDIFQLGTPYNYHRHPTSTITPSTTPSYHPTSSLHYR